MTPFAAIVGGGGGGLGGAALGHILVTLAKRAGSEAWLKGPYGPSFFDIALYMSVLCGCVGLGLSRRPLPPLIGLFGPFLGIALPMMIMTRTAAWGMGPDDPPTMAWYYAVGVVYILAIWTTMLALGAALSERRRWLGALFGAGGAFGGYLLLAGLLWAAPSYQRVLWSPTKMIPSPVALLDGLLTGAGLGAGVWLACKPQRKEEHES